MLSVACCTATCPHLGVGLGRGEGGGEVLLAPSADASAPNAALGTRRSTRYAAPEDVVAVVKEPLYSIRPYVLCEPMHKTGCTCKGV